MIDAFGRYREQLASTLAGTSTEAEAKKAIDDWARLMSEDDALADIFYRCNAQTKMAGQLFVRDVEAVKSLSRVQLKTQQAPFTTSFVNAPFEEAIAYFRSRTFVEPEEFDDMLDQERFRSFTMRLVASESIRRTAQEQLSRAFQPDGIGLREFIRAVGGDAVNLGMSPQYHGYLENVFRTNTAVAYNAGRLSGQLHPDVIKGTGYWQYLTVGDDRVREEHAALADKIWRIGDEQALTVYPPNGFQCRCSVVVLDREDVEPDKLERTISSDEIDKAITDGFRGPPTGDWAEQ